MEVLRSVRARWPRPRGAPGPDATGSALSWIGDERTAISGVPPVWAVARLAGQGVTHVVNCRPRAQVRRYGDLAAEQAAFGPGQVAHAPMQDQAGGSGLRCGRRRRASPCGCWRISRRRQCSSTAARAGAARPCSPTRCSHQLMRSD